MIEGDYVGGIYGRENCGNQTVVIVGRHRPHLPHQAEEERQLSWEFVAEIVLLKVELGSAPDMPGRPASSMQDPTHWVITASGPGPAQEDKALDLKAAFLGSTDNACNGSALMDR